MIRIHFRPEVVEASWKQKGRAISHLPKTADTDHHLLFDGQVDRTLDWEDMEASICRLTSVLLVAVLGLVSLL